MQQVITDYNKPIKLWLKKEDLEEKALQQAADVANAPYVFKHISIMPDSHMGYGVPIGCVFASKEAVVPNAIGVDIGCGMSMERTNLTDISEEDLKTVMGKIRDSVPVGKKSHSKGHSAEFMPDYSDNRGDLPIVREQFNKARYQLGTLGGGNHFIEIQKGDDGYIWFMVHSGSRNIGFTVAKHYHELAQNLCNRWYSLVPKDLSFLPLDSKEGQNYINEMNYCIEYAKANHMWMRFAIRNAFRDIYSNVDFSDYLHKPHNFARWEHHFSTNVFVHRKGATAAREGELGMIPGSQGSSSYLIEGLGEPQSFQSCSHGAGRALGRKDAQRKLDLQEEQQKLKDMGVVHSVRNNKNLEEAPSAYKNIDRVMENQTDLVNVKLKLEPLAVIKG